MDDLLKSLRGSFEDDPLRSALPIVVALGLIWLSRAVPRWVERLNERAVPYTVPEPDAIKPGWKGEVLDEPSIKEPGLSAIVCYCPATGQKLGHVNPTSAEGIDRAVEAAATAQKAWARTTFSQRRKVLRTLLQFLLSNQEAMARVAARDSGKPLLDASYGEILVTAEKLRWTLRHGARALAPSRRPVNLLLAYKRAEVRYEPLGVVAALVSWNYPCHNVLGPVIAALFAGNAVVVKPSERTAWSAAYFLAVARGALRACGHPPQLVQSLPMWPPTAGHLTAHPGVAHVTFIGSKPVAHHVLAAAAKALTPCCVELGGKDPAVVLDDVRRSDFAGVGHILLRGVFQSAGQNCVGIERIIALPQVYPAVVSFLEERTKALRLGSGMDDGEGVDVGAMVSADGFARLEALIAEAVAQGARLLAGGKRYAHPKHPAGHYFAPTLLADVTPGMRVAQEELFAPVGLVMRAASVADAVAMANGTLYGLGASVFGTAPRDLDAVVAGLRCGMVAVNDFAAYYAVQLPFGGVGGSGYGRFAGEEGLRGLSNAKSVCVDAWPLAKTRIPRPHLYPIANARTAWQVARGIVWLGYGGWSEKARGLWDIVRGI